MGTSDAFYPSQKAVKSYVDSTLASANISIGTIAGTSTANGASITSGVINLTPADGTNGGVVTTGIQTFAGVKTFSTDAIVNGITIGIGGQNQFGNTAIGLSALLNNTNGDGNTAIGERALSSNTNGNSNAASGWRALSSNTNGNSNTASGAGALYLNTNGNSNTASGAGALLFNADGNSNTAIGYYAGRKIADDSKNTTSDYSVYLGSSTKASADNAQNEVVIGYNAIGAGSNTIQLGNTAITDVKTSGTLTAGTVTYPNVHNSTSGQVLITDGNGFASFGSIPVLNQTTTGSAATLTTPRTIHGGSFDGSANVTNIIASTYGGTGNGFTKFTGPSSSEKTFTLPDADATILTSNTTVTVAQGGTGTNNGSITGTSALTFAAGGTNQNVSILASGTGSVGIGTNSPSSSAALDVSSTAKGFLPPRLTTTQRDAITSPAEGLTIWNNINKQLEVYDGTYWVNMAGKLVHTLNVGDTYGGGKVAYIFTSNDPGYVAKEVHGLIAAEIDQSTGIQWFKNRTSIVTLKTLGTGAANTLAIIGYAGATTLNSYAAGIASNYRGGNYSDWYLPSQDELNKLYLNKNFIGMENPTGIYWTSSQNGTSTAFKQDFSNGSQGSDLKDTVLNSVRAIRSF